MNMKTTENTERKERAGEPGSGRAGEPESRGVGEPGSGRLEDRRCLCEKWSDVTIPMEYEGILIHKERKGL